MESGFYAAFTGLVARLEALDVAANNLANVNTTGYKAEREFYRAFTAASRNAARLSPLNRAVNDYGILGGTTIDLGPGSLEHTGNDFDVALEGRGFLTVQTSAGPRYTRNGNLHIGPDGKLLTAQNDPVLGEPGRPIQIFGSGRISISTDGTISSNGAVIARLKLVDFPAGTPFTPEGNSYFAAPKESERNVSSSVAVRQGNLEASNFSAVAGATGLIALQRHAELLRRALTIFNDDFDRVAAQQIPSLT
jgi:flagellar basal-body rod protein FlgF